MMKRNLIICLMLMSLAQASGQADPFERAKFQVDSILKKIEVEPDPENRFQQVLSIYGTPSEGFPVLMFELYQRLLLIGQKQKDLRMESNAWSFAGQGCRLTGDYIKALDNHHKALTLAERSGDPLVIGYAQNQMAHIYKDREEYEKAISLYKAAAVNIEKGNNEFLRMWPQMNLGYVLMKTDELDSSLYYSQKALDKTVAQEIKGYKDYLLANIGSAYSKKNDTVKAAKYFREAIDIAKKSGSPRFLNNTYLAVAEHFCRIGKKDSCVAYAKKAIDAVRMTNMSNLVLTPAKMLTDIYQQSDADSTLKYLRVYRVANDSLYNVRANQQLQMMTFEEDQRQHNLETEKILYKNKIRMNIMLAGIGIACLIAFILYRNNLQRKKANHVLSRTLDNLKSTQQQLIQSEKMASLGELTAGIAHEIQNPLNFVNNFSEVSTELIEEAAEAVGIGQRAVDQSSEVAELLSEIKENLIKINLHGKRADAIVKGMLQHSQIRSGVKELTDINALADEYLRLAISNQKTKDPSFEIDVQTNFDPAIGKINSVPQDIAKVLVNVYNNAFYACNERRRRDRACPVSIITVSTKQSRSKTEITVTDNGTGIDPKIIDKIFQPFFTTKPTGQGTGLGLSLAYDIIKTHGGEIRVNSIPGKGAEFVISLPLSG